MSHQLVRWSIKTSFILITALLSTVIIHKTSYSVILADTADYQIDIGDTYAEPGQIIKVPIQTKNINSLGAFLIRFTYDSTIMRPYLMEYQSKRIDPDYYRNYFNLDLPDIVYDSTILSGRGVETKYIDSSGRYCYPPHNVDTIYNVYAFHHPYDDSMHVEAVFLIFLPPMPPYDECQLNYWSQPYLPEGEDTVSTFAYVLFQVESDAIPGTISDITVCNYVQSSPTDPVSDYRDNQFTDTDVNGYLFPPEGLGSGKIFIEEYFSYCGNVDGMAGINILDVVFIINYKYKSGPAPDPLNLADIDGIAPVNILDIVHLINFIYKDGSNPACP